MAVKATADIGTIGWAKVSFDESAREGTKRGSRQFSRGKIDELRLNDEKPSFASGRETRCR
jgi:hypothetical protein